MSPINYGTDVMNGALMALKAAGIGDERQRTQLLQKFQESQMATQEAQRQHIQSQMRLEQLKELQALQQAQNQAKFQQYAQGLMAPKTLNAPDEGGGQVNVPIDYDAMRHQLAMGAIGLLPPEKSAPFLKELGGGEKPVIVPQGGTAINSSGRVLYQGEPKQEKIPSMGNPVDIAINRKFQDSTYLTDPEKHKIALKWLGTPEGIQATRDAAQDVAQIRFSPVVTDQGITPFQSSGPGAGGFRQPTGLGKPLTDAQLAKVGELNAVLTNIGRTKELYKYGTAEEHGEWVGPIAGRKGGLEAKYLGTASDDQVKFYAYVKDMQDALLRARSGAQINEQEYARLVNFLPDPNLPASTFKSKLDRFEEATKIVMEQKLAAYQQGGYGVGTLGGQGNQGQTGGKTRFVIKGKPYNIPNELVPQFKKEMGIK